MRSFVLLEVAQVGVDLAEDVRCVKSEADLATTHCLHRGRAALHLVRQSVLALVAILVLVVGRSAVYHKQRTLDDLKRVLLVT